MKKQKFMKEDEKSFWLKTGREIQLLRQSKGRGEDKREKMVSQKKLGDIVGLSRASIANIEGGRTRIDLFTFQKIMLALS